jgi:hypothetical protein
MLTRDQAQTQCSNPLTARSTSASTTPQTADFAVLALTFALALALCSCLCKISCTCHTVPVLVIHTSRPAAGNSTVLSASSRAHHQRNQESHTQILESEAQRRRSKQHFRHV